MPSPRYRLLVDVMAADIRAGRLTPGTRLPTHRRLAADHGMAVATATRVYTELAAAGLVSREQGRGTFVRDQALPAGHGIDQDAVGDDVVDLNFNYPSLPGQGEALREVLRDIAGSGDIDSLLRYQPHAGRTQDRAVVAAHLRRRGVPMEGDRVLVTSGAQHGLAVTLMATLRVGDVLAVDALTYPGIKVLATALRLELVPVPVGTGGTDLDALERICAMRPVRAVYTMPTMHNPLGAVLAEDGRRRLVALARRYGVVLIEDASYAYLVDDAPAPLATLGPDVTVHVAGLSKSVATGLRVGFLSAPRDLVPALERAVRATTWNTPALTVEIATRWLRDGTVERLEADKRTDAARRQVVAREALAGLTLVGHPSSYFVWVPLPDDARADRVAGSLRDRQVSVSTAEPFATTTVVPQAIRLALGSTDVDDLASTLATVAEVVRLDPAT